jgi:hypothetical protein
LPFVALRCDEFSVDLRPMKAGPDGARKCRSAYRLRMDPCPRDVRRYTVRGHAIDVIPSDQDQWGVSVDGMEVGARFTTSQSAWAAGVAESFRLAPSGEPRTFARSPSDY